MIGRRTGLGQEGGRLPDRVDDAAGVEQEERALRRDACLLLARLLSAPPDAALLEALGAPPPADSALESNSARQSPDGQQRGDVDSPHGGDGWSALREAAAATGLEAVAEEFQALFIGLGSGEVVPYASFHLTGNLNDTPLADLRDELRALGIERSAGNREPEDHAAALLECLSLLLDSSSDDAARTFFGRHIASWMDPFLADLAHARSASFYCAVARLGRQLLASEAACLGITLAKARPAQASQQEIEDPRMARARRF